MLKPMPIRVLPTQLVNKIAAGEVVERPASIVKELLENAIDAGATRIDVTVEDGGRRLIAVADNGGGMSDDDLALAFAPHATSKIADEDDLFAIGTMGFRGEAMASIASVTHAHIRTRRGDDDAGHEITAGGQLRPCAAAPGTTVTVRDLFFNTPARRKFMKTANTEFGHIGEQLTRLALPNPQTAFTLTHNGREVQNLPAVASTSQRARDLFGSELAQSLIPVVQREGAVGVAGLLGAPAAARAASRWQYFFLNGRYIRDRVLAHALREAYRGLADPSRWPVALLFVEVDPADVDVNVHPTKIEVRFRHADAVHGQVLAALRETLNRSSAPAAASLSAAQDADAATEKAGGADERRRQSLREAMADFFKSAAPAQPRLRFPEPPSRYVTHGPATPAAARADLPQWPRGSAHAERAAAAQPVAGAEPASTPPQMDVLREAAQHAIQLHNAYIVAACDDGVLIIDQHALHERILYNELKARLAEGAAGLAAQRLLIPATINVTAAEADALAGQSDLLKRLGIEVAPFGPGTLAVQQFPSLLIGRRADPAEFLRELLDRLTDAPAATAEQLLEDVLAMMACKAAVKAGDPLSQQEIDELLAARDEAEKVSACPHGRPAVLKMTLKDLERQFGRA